MVSVYTPDLCCPRTKDENLEVLSSRLDIVRGVVEAERLRDPHTEVMIAGDFNRHNPLWEEVTLEKSEPIVELMADLSLQSLLPVEVTTLGQ